MKKGALKIKKMRNLVFWLLILVAGGLFLALVFVPKFVAWDVQAPAEPIADEYRERFFTEAAPILEELERFKSTKLATIAFSDQ